MRSALLVPFAAFCLGGLVAPEHFNVSLPAVDFLSVCLVVVHLFGWLE